MLYEVITGMYRVKKGKRKNLLTRLLIWRLRHLSNRNFMLLLSLIVGVAVGLAAVIIKLSVYFTRTLLTSGFSADYVITSYSIHYTKLYDQ